MTSETSGSGDDNDLPPLPGLQFTTYLGGPPPESGGPPEYADLPAQELCDRIEADRRDGANDQESLAAGFRSRAPSARAGWGSGFESGGSLDSSAPDCFLAGLTDAVTRDGHLAELSDDALVGAMQAWQRLGSWCASGLMTTVAELARRRPAPKTRPAPPGQFPERISEFAVDEVAHALTLTGRAADRVYAVALDLKTRLPRTDRALHEGLIDKDRAQLISELTRNLSDADARTVEAQIIADAGDQTTGQLRAALARAVIAVDPEAAARRREEALKDPRVRQWQEDAGTAALAGFGLPPAEALAADQRLSVRARALRAAGLPGTLEELRVRAYLDALLGTDSTPTPPPSPGTTSSPREPSQTRNPREPSQTRNPREPGEPGEPGATGSPPEASGPSGPHEPGQPGRPGEPSESSGSCATSGRRGYRCLARPATRAPGRRPAGCRNWPKGSMGVRNGRWPAGRPTTRTISSATSSAPWPSGKIAARLAASTLGACPAMAYLVRL